MKQANFWVSVAAMVSSVAAACVIALPRGLSWTGFAWVALALVAGALSIALVTRRSAARSTFDLIQHVEGEPAPAVPPAGRTNVSKGRETP